jgi:hypothetical protein
MAQEPTNQLYKLTVICNSALHRRSRSAPWRLCYRPGKQNIISSTWQPRNHTQATARSLSTRKAKHGCQHMASTKNYTQATARFQIATGIQETAPMIIYGRSRCIHQTADCMDADVLHTGTERQQLLKNARAATSEQNARGATSE